MVNILVRFFPIWAIFFSTIAYLQPSSFISFKNLIIPLLSLVMLSMGLTLNVNDFKRVSHMKRAVLLGVILQFLIMPLLAFGLSEILGLDNNLLVGMVLVGSVAGGTASNVICFLAGANVPLSITMTATSTLLGVFITPLLVGLYTHQVIEVPILSMLLSLIKIVLLPVTIGVCVNTFFKKNVRPLTPLFPLIAMVIIVFIISIIVALNANNIGSLGVLVVIAVVLHNGFGLCFGYLGAKLLAFDKATCRTVAIEVGMQNSGLAVALSMKYFSSMSALPGAVFSIWHNISGSMLASYWSSKKT